MHDYECTVCCKLWQSERLLVTCPDEDCQAMLREILQTCTECGRSRCICDRGHDDEWGESQLSD